MKKSMKYLLVILTVAGILFIGFKKNVNVDDMQVYDLIFAQIQRVSIR